MKIGFIGTGSGKTSLSRYHSSLLFAGIDYNLLVDAGDSVSRALLNQKIPYNSINGILISHLHPDHYNGLAELIVQMKMEDRQTPLSIFVHHTLVKTIKDFLQSSYVFMERMDFNIEFTGFSFEHEIFITSELSFISRGNTHLQKYQKHDASLSYVSGSFLFKSGESNIFYSGDIGSAEDLFLFKDFPVNIFITETTHAAIDEIINAVRQLKPGKIFLTHLDDDDLPVLISKIENAKDFSFVIAEDGLYLSV